ncbi:yjeF C-terminal region, hydroxyethylthiazole kinase-related [Flavobacterium flevense]|uniref:ADP-dependent (S)-NAD(P)H-hydrate dehydratase n=1 Tax=Flavobacterium flevense TaxID=983 RepID=A0A4Y4AZ54_9FLAO|nr:NAD(P)H-hydrate dehydratase [Flavobacterium flevense]GEC73565.1 ADP-dependent (S)-NAD(P)H-hydrate dehydratase [Flavobacterium flevense]SHM11985.1 yjeF C-terminal region, hydroxyethylthiazole kinase-related [Flavobacterium flevense]
MMTPVSIDKNEILKYYKPIAVDTHKGIQGHALIIGGSYGKIGAVCLSSKAALKAGCGLVTAYIPKCGYQIVQIAIPEVMVLTDRNKKCISNISFDLQPDAIGIGPGIGQDEVTRKAFLKFLKTNEIPLVIDADGLNILSQNKAWFLLLQPGTILTPHPKELERLIGKWISEEEKFEKTISFSLQYNVIVVMKGAPTYIIDGETLYKNTTGNQALATAGSGDVLTGIISSFLAQGYESVQAAILGVYLHGLTADLAAPKTGFQSFIASDSISNLGAAFLSLE